jgi:hypothetical protein
MKIKLLKNHLKNVEGDVLEVSDEQANYFVRCKVGEYDDPNAPVTKAPKKVAAPKKPKIPKVAKAPKAPKQTKEVKPKLETK